MEQLCLLLGLKKRPAAGDNASAATQCKPLELPDDFLSSPPLNPITYERIDWSQTALPEYGLRYAVVLDGVLTAEECTRLLDLAQQAQRGNTNDPWQPAMVNLGPGRDVHKNDLRSCDRFVWDHQQLADRLWDRIALAPTIAETLSTADWAVSQDFPQYYWKFRGLDSKMRFLRYQEGQYFKPHKDGSHTEFPPNRLVKSHFTMHLYLCDSKRCAPQADLDGGATTFLSDDEQRQVDVHPRAGRVLIFQQRSMYHAGADVHAGTKYTMRTDIQYELTGKESGNPVDPMTIGHG